MPDTPENLRARLDGGLVPAVPATLDAAGRLHARAHDSYLRHMSEQPLAAKRKGRADFSPETGIAQRLGTVAGE